MESVLVGDNSVTSIKWASKEIYVAGYSVIETAVRWKKILCLVGLI
jgi:hypothetical protein